MTASNGHAPAVVPQNLEAEQSVLGAVLLADTALSGLLDESLRPEHFYRDEHARIFQAMLDLHTVGEPVDALTLVEHLKQGGLLDRVGGRAAVDLLASSVPVVGNVRQYARIVRGLAWKRDQLQQMHRALTAVQGDDQDAFARALQELVDASTSGPLASSDWLDGVPMDPAAEAPEPLPPIPGFPFLHHGAGAVIVGPTGGGRSSLVQACAHDAAQAGVRVAYLGSEVTEAEFNARAADLAARRGDAIDDELRLALARVRYLNLASVITQAWRHPDHWTSHARDRFDVVVIDPLSAVASALDLDFDKSNAEFVRFYDRLVQPLAAAGVAVVMLENIGHAFEARSRAKGASAKQDRADLTFSCKLVAQPVGLALTAHKVRTVRAPFRRGDSWIFDRESQRIERGDANQDHDEATFRPTVLMERVSHALETSPGLTRRALRSAVQGKHDAKEHALELLISEGYVERRDDAPWPKHFSTRPFRAADDTGPRLAPDRPPNPTRSPGPLVPSLKDQGPEAAPSSAIFDYEPEGPGV